LSGPGAEVLGGDGRAAEEEAVFMSPEAVAEREASRTEYEGLSSEEAVALAERDFGIGRSSWVSPGSVDKGRITGYVGEYDAAETTAVGKHVLVSSSVPLRSRVGSGQLEPLSFSLEDRGNEFEPANPLAPVAFAKNPERGIGLPLGLGVAPGSAKGGQSGRVVGDHVVYRILGNANVWQFDGGIPHEVGRVGTVSKAWSRKQKTRWTR
jgi:hypothetical protein